MEYSAFLKLCNIIRPQVQFDDEMSRCRTSKGPITVEIMIRCLLQWFGGGSYLDIRLCAGICPTAFHCCTYKCIDAIFNSEDLS